MACIVRITPEGISTVRVRCMLMRGDVSCMEYVYSKTCPEGATCSARGIQWGTCSNPKAKEMRMIKKMKVRNLRVQSF